MDWSSHSQDNCPALDKRLTTYLAATAGAGAVAANNAEAVVVADLTPRPFGINESVDIDFNSDGVVDFQIDHDRVDLNGTNLDFLQIDKNDINGALSTTPVESELVPVDGFASFPGTPADYTGDGQWNAADYTVWRDNLGQSGVAGDGDGSGTVDQPDYDVFHNAFGKDPAPANYDAGYMSDELLCGPFSSGGCHPLALSAGTEIGPNEYFEFSESTNAFDNGTVLRANRLIDEDNGQLDASFGLTPEPQLDSPTFSDVDGTQYLGVRIDLNDAGFNGNDFAGANGPGDTDDPANYWYGWIGVEITNQDDATGIVTGYGYETDMGVAITAGATGAVGSAVPEPGSALMLLLGGAMLLGSFFTRRCRKLLLS